jgi:hypothetical protein
MENNNCHSTLYYNMCLFIHLYVHSHVIHREKNSEPQKKEGSLKPRSKEIC